MGLVWILESETLLTRVFVSLFQLFFFTIAFMFLFGSGRRSTSQYCACGTLANSLASTEIIVAQNYIYIYLRFFQVGMPFFQLIIFQDIIQGSSPSLSRVQFSLDLRIESNKQSTNKTKSTKVHFPAQPKGPTLNPTHLKSNSINFKQLVYF